MDCKNRRKGEQMIQIEKTEIYGWEAAIRGMRNPLNSWAKSDSFMCKEDESGEAYKICKTCPKFGKCEIYDDAEHFIVGSNDLDLMKRLTKAGDDHGKVARYLEVYVDITAPFYFWKEFRTYRKGRKFMDDGDELLDPDDFEMHIETNSCSTMHKIHAKEFTLDDFSTEHLMAGALDVMNTTIDHLNFCRRWFLAEGKKEWWWQMIQLLPSSYNQKRTVKLNYQVLKNMYHARKNHKLDEWRVLCEWIESLPYSELITGND